MGTLTSRTLQQKTAAAARRVGGYDKLIELDAQRKAAGPGAKIARDAKTGAFIVSAPPPAPKR